MPEPTSSISLNKPIYNVSNKVSKNVCGNIRANSVTLFGAILSILIIYVVVNFPCRYKERFILTMIRAYLDILDGSIARTCKESSEFGSKFDNRLKNAPIPIILLSGLPIFMSWYESLNKRPGGWVDNDILAKPIYYTCIVYLSSKCRE